MRENCWHSDPIKPEEEFVQASESTKSTVSQKVQRRKRAEATRLVKINLKAKTHSQAWIQFNLYCTLQLQSQIHTARKLSFVIEMQAITDPSQLFEWVGNLFQPNQNGGTAQQANALQTSQQRVCAPRSVLRRNRARNVPKRVTFSVEIANSVTIPVSCISPSFKSSRNVRLSRPCHHPTSPSASTSHKQTFLIM